jgi:hypothetical protein
MGLVMDHAEIPTGMARGHSMAPLPPTLAYEAASRNPELFYELLDGRSNQKAQRILWWVAISNVDAFKGAPFYSKPGTLMELLGLLEIRAASKDVRAANTASTALSYLRRRFAKELAMVKKKQEQ